MFVQPASYPSHAATGEPLGEDPPYVPRGQRIRIQLLLTPPPGRVRPIRMGSGVHQSVPVGRPNPEEPALLNRLSGHRRQRPVPRPHYLALRLRSEYLHQHPVVRVGEIHRPARLGQPHRHALCDQQCGDLMELAIGERPLELPDHDGIETTGHSLRLLQQRRRPRPPHPRHPT
ncbi:hypothetical protein Pdca_15590 [Pseudonocardia autotrophica]|nr:hypothetical protein Pdca_15590 [Pseudonocardia autotrophica]